MGEAATALERSLEAAATIFAAGVDEAQQRQWWHRCRGLLCWVVVWCVVFFVFAEDYEQPPMNGTKSTGSTLPHLPVRLQIAAAVACGAWGSIELFVACFFVKDEWLRLQRQLGEIRITLR